MKYLLVAVLALFVEASAAEDKWVYTPGAHCVGGNRVLHVFQTKEDKRIPQEQFAIGVAYRTVTCVPITISKFNFFAVFGSAQLVAWNDFGARNCSLIVNGIEIDQKAQNAEQRDGSAHSAVVDFEIAVEELTFSPGDEIRVEYRCRTRFETTKPAAPLGVVILSGKYQSPKAVMDFIATDQAARPKIQLRDNGPIKGAEKHFKGGRWT